MALVSLLLALSCGDEPVVQSAASAHSPSEVVGTWETDQNDFKWTFTAEGGELGVHGWDSSSGRAFRVADVRWTGSGPAFRTSGPTGDTPAMEHELSIVDTDTLSVHCELEDGSEMDFQLKRIPGLR